MKTKTVKLTLQEILNLGSIIKEFDAWGSGNIKVAPLSELFVQALVYNAIAIDPSVMEYQALDSKVTEFTEYKKDLVKLQRDHALKGKDGKPVSVQGNYFPENFAEYELALFELKEKHKEAYEQRMVKLNEIRTLELATVEQRYIPKQGIAISVLKQLSVFIEPDTTTDTPEAEIKA